MPKEVRATTSHRTSPLHIPTERRSSLHIPPSIPDPRHAFGHVRTISEPQVSSNRATSTWSAQDDETLMSARASGLNWGPIATKYFPNKTANACRKRHERLMERRNAEDWDGVKLETLAREYMEVRREMWEVLGRRVNEKWQVVEAKCMEKGLKNLQSAYRSAARKSRGMSDHSDDSGIGFEDDAEGEADDGTDPTGAGPSRGVSVSSAPGYAMAGPSSLPASMLAASASASFDPTLAAYQAAAGGYSTLRRDSAGSAGSAGSLTLSYATLPSATISEQQQAAAQGLQDLRSRGGGFSVQSMLSPAHQM